MSDSALRACRSRRVCDPRSPTAPKRFMNSFFGGLVGEVAATKDESPPTDMRATKAHRHSELEANLLMPQEAENDNFSECALI